MLKGHKQSAVYPASRSNFLHIHHSSTFYLIFPLPVSPLFWKLALLCFFIRFPVEHAGRNAW